MYVNNLVSLFPSGYYYQRLYANVIKFSKFVSIVYPCACVFDVYSCIYYVTHVEVAKFLYV